MSINYILDDHWSLILDPFCWPRWVGCIICHFWLAGAIAWSYDGFIEVAHWRGPFVLGCRDPAAHSSSWPRWVGRMIHDLLLEPRRKLLGVYWRDSLKGTMIRRPLPSVGLGGLPAAAAACKLTFLLCSSLPNIGSQSEHRRSGRGGERDGCKIHTFDILYNKRKLLKILFSDGF